MAELMSANPKRPPTVEGAEDFLNGLEGSPQTVATYGYAMLTFRRFLDQTRYVAPPFPEESSFPAAQLRDDVLMLFANWLSEQYSSTSTRTTYMAAVKRLLVWLDAHDALSPHFQLGKAQNRLSAGRGRRRAPYPTKQVDPELPRLVLYYDQLPMPAGMGRRTRLACLNLLRNRALMHILYDSGGRISEVISLTRAMVMDGRAERVVLRGKGDKQRTILLTRESREAIRAYLKSREDDTTTLFISHGRGRGKALTRASAWRIVKEAALALDLYSGTSPHSFRHYRAAQLLNEGMPLESVQAFLGHVDPSTTRRIYAPYTEAAVLADQLATYGKSPEEALKTVNHKDE